MCNELVAIALRDVEVLIFASIFDRFTSRAFRKWVQDLNFCILWVYELWCTLQAICFTVTKTKHLSLCKRAFLAVESTARFSGLFLFICLPSVVVNIVFHSLNVCQ